MDNEKRIQQIEQKIVRIKEELGKIGPMRPGSLTRQYRDPVVSNYSMAAKGADFHGIGAWLRQAEH